ncbi:hypothetical protein OIU19_03220 [Pseudomonas sp. BT-42-2]|uniref:hypothetical protein n=1 Tax=Pseudomonas sp. BT-42-2 TaxID=2986927 RepID=UPI0021F742DF|nr:hypothetical protein [Pseudomonas sp. BT-42-2]MCV9917792.1 hypothetical protein [Pseudomonas sp. BT-42-2]
MEPVQTASIAISWLDVGKIVLGSGVVAGIVGWIKDSWNKRSDRRREAKYAAIEALAMLDLYVLESRKNVRRYYEDSAGLTPEAHYQMWPSCSYPDFLFPQETLKRLSAEDACRISWLSTEKEVAHQYLAAIHEDELDPTRVEGHQAKMVGYFGYEAFLLSKSMRARYRLSSMPRAMNADDHFDDLFSYWLSTKSEFEKRSELLRREG